VALREIRKLQQSTNLLLPRLPFQRLVRQVAARSSTTCDKRFRAGAIDALQEAAEAFLVAMFGDMNVYAIHGKRITINENDCDLACWKRGIKRAPSPRDGST
jgi:histone H3